MPWWLKRWEEQHSDRIPANVKPMLRWHDDAGRVTVPNLGGWFLWSVSNKAIRPFREIFL